MQNKFMRLAINLAKRGLGSTSPNPLVGAVIVKNNKIISTGFHRLAGLEHAEVAAIRNAGRQAKGASLYVSLEPCRHFGKTPPCTDAIIKAGIKEVFIGAIDPNPVNNGKGVRVLRKAGINVKTGVLEDECNDLNEVFIKYISKHMPFVTVKLAQTLDGKIASYTGDSKWITNVKSRDYVHRLRSINDAVLVGANTIIKDDPLLTARPKFKYKNPRKIVIDPNLKIPFNSKIFSKESPAQAILVTAKNAPKNKIKRFESVAKILIVSKKGGSIDLKEMLKKLARLEITSVLVEGGGETAAKFFEAGLVDKALFFIAPKIIGGRNAKTSVEGSGVKNIADAGLLTGIKIRRFDEDILVEGYVYGHNRRDRSS